MCVLSRIRGAELLPECPSLALIRHPSHAVDGHVAQGEQVRVRGLVQGVGFRPTVWRIGRDLGLSGSVRNDGDGVLIYAWADAARIDELCRRLVADCPPLARIDSIERTPLAAAADSTEFVIIESAATAVHTGIVPDAATCAACAAEVADPADRRYRYPFTNCTHCGPRLSIVRGIPYDRAKTSMSVFPMCADCAAEYTDPADRRFHAQPNACASCGPRVWLADAEGKDIDLGTLGAQDAVDAASRLLAEGRIVAIKGLGGFHLACDATSVDAVAELRRRKRRWAKPLALMARDLATVRRYCAVSAAEAEMLSGPAAPILLLEIADVADARPLSPGVAPAQLALGFMLAYTPLHQMLLRDWQTPLVMTSGNLSDEPQCIDNADALDRLSTIADAFLLHDRDIVNRVDDSVVRQMDGTPRLLRRARGYAPAPLTLPEFLRDAPPVLALGGELKNTICLLQDGQAVLSQHLGDLQDARTAMEYERTINLYRDLLQHRPRAVAVDLHPNYRASQFGRRLAIDEDLELVEVQHHRAHIAAVLADNHWPLDAGPVLGVALDGSGFGDDGSIWGGEWLIGDYRRLDRVACLKRAALPGGTQAILEPWRNLFAQIEADTGWPAFQQRFAGLELTKRLQARPVQVLSAMIERGVNAPLTTSAGRLFDAVAAAVGVCVDQIAYEGQAAIELEVLCGDRHLDEGYPFSVLEEGGLRVLDPGPMWQQLFADLADGLAPSQIAARFHIGFADAVAALSADIASTSGLRTVALSGGVFQNRTLFERVTAGLRAGGLEVLSHRRVPTNDGGLALGQAAVAAALLLSPSR